MNILETFLEPYSSYKLVYKGECLLEKKGEYQSHSIIQFDDLELGEFFYSGESHFESNQIEALLKTAHHTHLDYALSLLSWLEQVRSLEPKLFNWVGIYFKESFLEKKTSEDLVIGPYIGEATDHTRIPINRGICGLALSQEKTVNIEDVHQRPEHIACSLLTNSELVIPLQDTKEEFIAELDIDSHTKAAFSSQVEGKVQLLCKSFPLF